MLKLTKNNVIKITTIFIFVIIGFIFIHSELGQFSFDEDNHDAHDYCQLVDGATLQLTKTSRDLLKLKIDKTISLNCMAIITEPLSYGNKIDFKQFDTPRKSSELYIYNSTFLI